MSGGGRAGGYGCVVLNVRTLSLEGDLSLVPCLKEASAARYGIVIAFLNVLLIHQSVLTLYV